VFQSIFRKDELIQLANQVREIADNGNRLGQELYGSLLLRGIGVKLSPIQAFDYFEMAAQNGSDIGHYMCGLQALSEFGISIDHEKALNSFRSAAPTMNAARYTLVHLLTRETNLMKQLKKRYRDELSRDSPFADLYEVSSHIREAITQIQYLADSADSWMLYVYGFCLELGFGVHRDASESVRLYKMIYLEIPEAQYRYSLCLRDGIGITQNLREAFLNLKGAANRGDSDAQYDLAMCLALGIGERKDERRSQEYLEKLAQSGNDNAKLIRKAMNIGEDISEMFECDKSEEEISVYDRRLPSECKKAESVIGYPTGWTRFLRFSMK
jgi:TPR repeat protein